jgi:hypothetical protein
MLACIPSRIFEFIVEVHGELVLFSCGTLGTRIIGNKNLITTTRGLGHDSSRTATIKQQDTIDAVVLSRLRGQTILFIYSWHHYLLLLSLFR